MLEQRTSRTKKIGVNRSVSTSQESGIALISVVFVMLCVIILAITFSFVALSEQQSTKTTRTVNQLTQLADATSERGRQLIAESYEEQGLSSKKYMTALRDTLDGSADHLPEIKGVHSATIDGVNVRWQITDVSPENNEYPWIEISATAESGDSNQTVIRQVSMGEPASLFAFAMLTETVNCMFCHLRVDGDVGALSHLRPGWGHEGGNGKNSGNHSKIYGNVYAASTVTNDQTNLTGTVKKINGAQIFGEVEVESKSRLLPKDTNGDGVADFPPIERELARTSAFGTVAVNASASDGARMRLIPLDGKINDTTELYSGNQTTLSGVVDGNLILVGTEANPINLDEDIFVEGDIVISGVVTGRGALYAGRNIYIADNVTVKNPQDKAGTGVCAGITEADECALKNIAANKDAIRLAARGSAIMGDYTEYNNGALQPFTERQSALFYRAQFGFNNNNTRYYDKTTGDELTKIDNKYYNVDNVEISSSSVINKTTKRGRPASEIASDAYSYSFRPAHIKDDGSLNIWLSDELYQDLLGEETIDTRTFRWDWTVNNKNWKNITESQYKDEVRSAIEGMGFTPKESDLDDAFDDRKKNNWVNIKDTSGTIVARINRNKMQSKTVIDQTKQITEVDAFIYANERIGASTVSRPMVINGGLIAKTIGILAPGRRNGQCQNPSNTYYVENHIDCRATVNYDYRLRNGGYGFNLVEGETGRTLSWRLADTEAERVVAPSEGGQ